MFTSSVEKELTDIQKLIFLNNITSALYEAGFKKLASQVRAEANKIIGAK